LWYGTLQVGPYLHSRAYNPRSVFEGAVFDYTSLDEVPIIVTARTSGCDPRQLPAVSLVYWTARDRTPHRVAPRELQDRLFTFEMAPPGRDAVIYYYFTATWPSEAPTIVHSTPFAGAAAPLVYFVSQDHLGDLDVRGDLLDVFDLIRIVRYIAWGEAPRFASTLKAAGIAPDDVERVADVLTRAIDVEPPPAGRLVSALHHDATEARLSFHDGSSIVVPRAWSGRITDVEFNGPLALALMHATTSLRALALDGHSRTRSPEEWCVELADISINRVFYRTEPHQMRRYLALAFDNIRRDPRAFAASSAYRAIRLFVIEGTDDEHTAQQFAHSRLVYALGTAASLTSLLFLLAGAVIAWRRHYRVGLPLILIASVPATLAPVLTNMRYTITVQPLVFMFVAVTTMALLERVGLLHRVDSQFSRQPS
jgi:hypothetical protein